MTAKRVITIAMRLHPLFLSALSFGLAGCATNGHDTAVTMVDVGTLHSVQALPTTASSATMVDLAQWSCGDPQLAALYSRAFASSPTYAQALSRVRRADAVAGQYRAVLLPQLTGDASVRDAKLSYNQGIPSQFVPKGLHSNSSITLSAMWDADLWGRNRAALAVATSEAEATRLDADQARLMLTATIGTAYVDYARALVDQATALQVFTQKQLEKKLAHERVQAGLDSQSAAEQADAALVAGRNITTQADDAVARARYQLAALVGTGPDDGLALKPPQFLISTDDFSQIGADVLAKRPDVAAAKSRVSAAAARVNVAQRNFYPNLSLSALFGVQSLNISDVLKTTSAIPSFGPALHLPIFEGGQLRATLNVERADYDNAVAIYNATVISALQDAATALSNLRGAALEMTLQAKVAQSRAHSYLLAQERFQHQLSSAVPQAEAAIALAQAQSDAENARLTAIGDRIGVLRALGGRIIPTKRGA